MTRISIAASVNVARYIHSPPLRAAQATRRFILLGFAALTIIFILFITSLRGTAQPASIVPAHAGTDRGPLDAPGKAIAPKLGNETAKYVGTQRITGSRKGAK